MQPWMNYLTNQTKKGMRMRTKQDKELTPLTLPQRERPSDWIGRSKIVDAGEEIFGIEIWGAETIRRFQCDLLAWYDTNKRDLPWRRTHSPYAIWVSEIMLQQTQVDTVIPYYERFMAMFPTVKALSEADEQALLKAWEGLGYYSRVRNMQAAAQQIMTDFGGTFPTSAKDIQTLKGIGPYTAGAVASIAFNEPVGAVDGNAMRVLGRLFTITLDISKAKTQKIYREIMQAIISTERPGDFNQAIMDLGSSYERAKNPDLEHSPIRAYSLGTLSGTALNYPVKNKKTKQVIRHFHAMIIENAEGEILIAQRTEKGLLHKLWTVPLLEQKSVLKKNAHVAETSTRYETNMSPDENDTWIGHVKHVFSHQIWEIDVYLPDLDAKQAQLLGERLTRRAPSQYVAIDQEESVPFPTVQDKIWQLVKTHKEKDKH
ncbi:MAG: A/G-specific adenine glycosylase [Aerococcus sp.]|nr:A/G-specific adenine glycosylase [Aerococcus sp.]